MGRDIAKTPRRLLAVLAASLLLFATSSVFAEDAMRPNIVYVLADDAATAGVLTDGAPSDRDRAHGPTPESKAPDCEPARRREHPDREPTKAEDARGQPSEGQTPSRPGSHCDEAGGDVSNRHDRPGVAAGLTPLGIRPDRDLVHGEIPEAPGRPLADFSRGRP